MNFPVDEVTILLLEETIGISNRPMVIITIQIDVIE